MSVRDIDHRQRGISTSGEKKRCPAFWCEPQRCNSALESAALSRAHPKQTASILRRRPRGALRADEIAFAFEHPAPAELVWEVFRGHAIGASPPRLRPAHLARAFARKNVSSASTMPLAVLALASLARVKNRCRQRERLGHAHAFRGRLSVGFPGFPLLRPRQRRSGRRVNPFAAFPAAIALQTAGSAQCPYVRAPAMGAQDFRSEPGFDHGHGAPVGT